MQKIRKDDAEEAGQNRVADGQEKEAREDLQAGVLVEAECEREDLHHREIDPAHHDRVANNTKIECTKEPQPGCWLAAVAKFRDLVVGEDTTASPKVTDDESSEDDREHVGPPEPVSRDAVGRDQSGDRERCVGGEGGRDDRGPGQPPRESSASCEEGLRVLGRASRVPCPPAKSKDEVRDDDADIESRQRGLRLLAIRPFVQALHGVGVLDYELLHHGAHGFRVVHRADDLAHEIVAELRGPR